MLAHAFILAQIEYKKLDRKEVKEVVELKIDPEFREKIPPLTEEEFNQLRDNILADGEIYEPIVTWNGIIVDGHNRYRIVQEHPEIPFHTKPMNFIDKWAAFEWMYRKQLGRRNLTPEQKRYLIGKTYEARKNTQGGTGANQYTAAKEQTGQNVHSATRRETKDGTAGEIGREFGVDGKTVRRAEHFAKGLDRAAEVDPEFKGEILTGKVKASGEAVAEMRGIDDDTEVKKAIAAIRKPKTKEQQKADKELFARIRALDSKMASAKGTITFDDVLADLNAIEDDFINKIERAIENQRVMLMADERWPDAIEGYFDSVVADIQNMKGSILK